MRVTISHEFRTSAETFWERCFLDEEFNRKLYLEYLKFPAYQLVESRQDGEKTLRKVRVTPNQEAPAPIKKLLGGAFAYVEEGVLDRAKNLYHFKVTPGTLADKIRSEGDFRLEKTSEKSVRRVIEMNIEVKIFGVGGVAEGFVSKSMQDTYARAAEFTSRYIAENHL
ncbi:MAG: DUF2505 domain-containing protein [Deltaproteobacteria bacterium]|nr:DUF2505 domain-containing protein [Deltaproteobacteria bacterium]